MIRRAFLPRPLKIYTVVTAASGALAAAAVEADRVVFVFETDWWRPKTKQDYAKIIGGVGMSMLWGASVAPFIPPILISSAIYLAAYPNLDAPMPKLELPTALTIVSDNVTETVESFTASISKPPPPKDL